jgi:hypothetical protein
MDRQSLFICKIQPVRPGMLTDGPASDEEKIIGEHASYLEGLVQQGVAYLVGRTLTTDYSTFGIFIFSAESEDAARRILEQDTVMKNRVMRAELYPFRASMVGKFPVA